jgi:hypothetical protein
MCKRSRYTVSLRNLCVVLNLLTGSIVILAQDFIEVSSSLTPIRMSSLDWADFDNDHDLDLLVTGITRDTQTVCNIYRNDGTIGFNVVSNDLPGFQCGTVDWGDYDADGDMDFIITGYNSDTDGIPQPTTKIFENKKCRFKELHSEILDVAFGASAWGDYDNDGDLDLVISGETREGFGQYETKLYQTHWKRHFIDSGIVLPGILYGALEWGDYDNDGNLDLIIAGSDQCFIYRNNGQAGFEPAGMNLLPVRNAAVAWGDYDNDGDLDLIVCGDSNSGSISIIYRNDNTCFTNIEAGLLGTQNGSADWGDYDNDGDLDLILTGRFQTLLYENTGSDSFELIPNSFPGVTYGHAKWADYDGDGDLDLAIAGDFVLKIYQNNCSQINLPPWSPETSCASVVSSNEVSFSWSSGSDSLTSVSGLTYNIFVGTSSNSVDVVPPHADPESGWRLTPAVGNMQESHSWSLVFQPTTNTDVEAESLSKPGLLATASSPTLLYDLPYATNLYWGVQSLDASHTGSEFFTGSIALPDNDHDGMNDLLENILGTSTNNIDSDLDGACDLFEYVSGTDPSLYTAPEDLFCIDDVFHSEMGTNTLVQWNGIDGRFYTVQCTTNLTEEWINTEFVSEPGTSGQMVYTGRNERVSMFYKVNVDLHP